MLKISYIVDGYVTNESETSWDIDKVEVLLDDTIKLANLHKKIGEVEYLADGFIRSMLAKWLLDNGLEYYAMYHEEDVHYLGDNNLMLPLTGDSVNEFLLSKLAEVKTPIGFPDGLIMVEDKTTEPDMVMIHRYDLWEEEAARVLNEVNDSDWLNIMNYVMQNKLIPEDNDGFIDWTDNYLYNSYNNYYSPSFEYQPDTLPLPELLDKVGHQLLYRGDLAESEYIYIDNAGLVAFNHFIPQLRAEGEYVKVIQDGNIGESPYYMAEVLKAFVNDENVPWTHVKLQAQLKETADKIVLGD